MSENKKRLYKTHFLTDPVEKLEPTKIIEPSSITTPKEEDVRQGCVMICYPGGEDVGIALSCLFSHQAINKLVKVNLKRF